MAPMGFLCSKPTLAEEVSSVLSPQVHTLCWRGMLFCGGVYVCVGEGRGVYRTPKRQDAEHTLCPVHGAPVSQPGQA